MTSVKSSPLAKRFVSSAYITHLRIVAEGMSFMYNRNKSGPKILPWGTPVSRGSGGLVQLSQYTYCFLLARYNLNHYRAVPLIP